MINPQNQRVDKIVEILEQMQLFTGEEITLMEDFLTGNLEEQALEKLTFHDFEEASGDTAARMRSAGQELVNRGRYEEALRLGKILFAVGQSTCYEVMPLQSYYSFDPNLLLVEEPEKKAAIYAAKIAMNEYQVSKHNVQNLIKLSEIGRAHV